MRPWMVLVCALVSLVGISSARMASAQAVAETIDTGWFLKRTQALYDAVARGDKAIWRRTLSDDCIVTDEDGHVYDKTEFLHTLSGLPKGFSGVIRVQRLTARIFGPAASVHYWLDEHEDVLGQMLHTVYVETDTYHRQGDTWRIIAAQVTVVPTDLKPVEVDERGWPQLAGSYRLGAQSGPVYRAYLRHGSLYWGTDEKSAKLLIPLSPLVFFVQGSIHIMVFVRDPAGHVTEALELHKYNEVVMRRSDR